MWVFLLFFVIAIKQTNYEHRLSILSLSTIEEYFIFYLPHRSTTGMVDSRATHAELIPTYAYLLIPKNLLANRRGRLNVWYGKRERETTTYTIHCLQIRVLRNE